MTTKSETRVDAILELMTTGKWIQNYSERQLAQKWEISISRVHQLGLEAKRTLRRLAKEDPEAREHVKALLIQFLDVVKVRALARTRRRWRKDYARGEDGKVHRVMVEYQEPDPDFKAAISAADKLGKYFGLEPVKEVRVNVDEFERWSDEELEEYAKEGETTQARKRLNGGEPVH